MAMTSYDIGGFNNASRVVPRIPTRKFIVTEDGENRREQDASHCAKCDKVYPDIELAPLPLQQYVERGDNPQYCGACWRELIKENR